MMEFRVSRHKWVDRHTWQSWLERFKKNAVAFSKRVERYTKASLDDDLKTAAERQAAIERLASSQDKGIANGANEAGPSKCKEKETTLSKSKEKEGTLNKRRLVDSDSDDEPRKKDPPRLALGRNRPGSSFPTQPLRVREPLFLPGPSSQIDGPETIEPVATQPPADGHAEETSVPDAVPLPAEMPTVVPTVVPAMEVRSEQPIEPQLGTASEQQPEQTMEQLPEQAIVQQPGQPSEQQPEQPSKPQTQTEQVEPQSAQTSELQSGQHPEQPTEQQTESPPEQRAAQPLELELDQPQPPTEQQSMPTEQIESAALSPPQAPTPPSTTHPPPQAPPTASPPAHSSPVVPAPTKAPPAGVLEEPSSPAPPQVTSAQPTASPGAYAPRSSAVADLVERRRMSKRRRTLATVAAPDEKPSLRRIIDTVSVSPGQLRTPPPPPREPGPYVPPAPLTPEQLQAKLDAGRNIVASVAQTYRSYINRWLAVYGVGQAEIMAAVEEVRARTDLTRAPLVFGEVERVLEERYGRVEEGA
ncbi:hypothetical protein CC85DRAFT_125897 [Cutaneotrichosporon oleaginosum]|uniref:Uncharacterized protein n=1 Tax=Cutaneotrichosporon oleaginosum TaxID=879819 RepID=A0A0J0XJJ5_9TREE|nr:uncharacterized protein CC85DRAFT_125897 [Cutaneotrichosporon oleaginosum]KLT41226.1 hypothetical protein CC85DRAFT_125897 [Cutaneotrichosporon oleaginosum]